MKIAPGDIIAYAGNSGGNWPVHLHISFGKIATEKLKESSSYREIYKELENNINNPLYHSAKKTQIGAFKSEKNIVNAIFI